MQGFNLAALSDEQRAEIEADKAACLIRHKCGHLGGRDRQLCAQRELSKIDREQIESVKIALKKRAQQNQ